MKKSKEVKFQEPALKRLEIRFGWFGKVGTKDKACPTGAESNLQKRFLGTGSSPQRPRMTGVFGQHECF